MKRRTIVIVVIVALLVAGFFGYRYFQQQSAAAATNYQTVALERGSLTAIVGATGTVRANQTAMLSWQTTGTVGKIHASVGDLVKTDEVLAELLRSSLPQNVIMAESDLISARRNLEDLRDSNLVRAKAQQDLVNAQKAVEDAQERVDSKSYTIASQDVIDVSYANYILAQNEVDRQQENYDGMAYLPEDDANRAAALSVLAAAKQRRDTALANYNRAKSRPDELDINLADANLEIAKANLADVQREWERVKNGVDPNDLAAAQARVESIEATLGLANVKAPFNGTITEVNVSPGDQVAPTLTAFRLDDLSHLIVDVLITEVDINRVRVGQDVDLTFDAILENEYHGKVTEVGQVGTAIQGVVNFKVTIELQDADESVLPGMTGAVNIVVQQLDDVLLVPNRAVRLRDGKRIIYVMRNGIPEIVEIEIGSTSEVNSEIVSDNLQAGDLVVLNPPSLDFGGPGFMQPGGGGGFGGGG
jgi:HlyD family secretion protein